MSYLDRALSTFWLRGGLANGFRCETAYGTAGTIKLVLEAETLYLDVSDCFDDLPLFSMLRQY